MYGRPLKSLEEVLLLKIKRPVHEVLMALMFVILLMAEILHHLGYMKPCK